MVALFFFSYFFLHDCLKQLSPSLRCRQTKPRYSPGFSLSATIANFALNDFLWGWGGGVLSQYATFPTLQKIIIIIIIIIIYKFLERHILKALWRFTILKINNLTNQKNDKKLV